MITLVITAFLASTRKQCWEATYTIRNLPCLDAGSKSVSTHGGVWSFVEISMARSGVEYRAYQEYRGIRDDDEKSGLRRTFVDDRKDVI
ncbi:hypothetical protein BDV06DRAFT_203771 [Aspergillus oleicola]